MVAKVLIEGKRVTVRWGLKEAGSSHTVEVDPAGHERTLVVFAISAHRPGAGRFVAVDQGPEK